jgi:hypothetical protein
VLIVLADQLGRSVGDMYEGALIPGLVLTGLYMRLRLPDDDRPADSMPACRSKRARCAADGVTSLFAALVVDDHQPSPMPRHIYLSPTTWRKCRHSRRRCRRRSASSTSSPFSTRA